MKHIFEEIAQIAINPNKINAKYFDLWNEQLLGLQNNSQPFNFPCIFIDFKDINQQPEGRTQLRCFVEFTLYLGWQFFLEPKKDQAIIGNAGILDFASKVTKHLNGYRSPQNNFTTIQQTAMRTNTKYTNVYVLEMDFTTTYVDSSSVPNLIVPNPMPVIDLETHLKV